MPLVAMDKALTSEEERGALRVWLRDCRKAIEVGTWTGGTAVAMAGAMPEDGILYCVDNFCGSEDPGIRQRCFGDYKESEVEQLWRNRIEQAGYTDKAQLLIRRSNETQGFEPESVDLIFIDACHEYPSPLEDIKAWWPIVKRGGLICGHDFAMDWPGVVESVREFFVGKELGEVLAGPQSLWRVYKK